MTMTDFTDDTKSKTEDAQSKAKKISAYLRTAH